MNFKPLDPVKQLPKMSSHFVKTLFSPVLLFFALLGNLCLAAGIFVFYTYEYGVNPNVNSWFDALWWGMSTVTTVGYGDIIPMTTEGRVTGIFLMMTGLILFISFSALLVSLFYARTESEIAETKAITYIELEAVLSELKEIRKEIESIKKTPSSS